MLPRCSEAALCDQSRTRWRLNREKHRLDEGTESYCLTKVCRCSRKIISGWNEPRRALADARKRRDQITSTRYPISETIRSIRCGESLAKILPHAYVVSPRPSTSTSGESIFPMISIGACNCASARVSRALPRGAVSRKTRISTNDAKIADWSAAEFPQENMIATPVALYCRVTTTLSKPASIRLLSPGHWSNISRTV